MVGQTKTEIGLVIDQSAKRAVIGRRREKEDVRTQIVAPALFVEMRRRIR